MKKMKYILGAALMMVLLAPAGTASARTATPARINIKKTFPDKKVRKAVREYDKNKDGYLSKAENKKIIDFTVQDEDSGSEKTDERFQKVNFEGCQYLTSINKVGTCYTVSAKDLKKEPFKSAETIWLDHVSSSNLDFSNCHKLSGIHIDEASNVKKVNFLKCKKLSSIALYLRDGEDVDIRLDQDAEIEDLTLWGPRFYAAEYRKEKPAVKITGGAQIRIRDVMCLRRLRLDTQKVIFPYFECLWECDEVYIRNAEMIYCQGGERDISRLVLKNTKVSYLDLSGFTNLKYINFEYGNQIRTLYLSGHDHIQKLFTDEFGNVNGSLSANPLQMIRVSDVILPEDLEFLQSETQKYPGRRVGLVEIKTPWDSTKESS